MPVPLIITLIAVSIVLTPLAVMLNLRPSRDSARFKGLILPTVLAVWVYASFVLLFLRYGASAFAMLPVINIPLVATLAVYLLIRMKRYERLVAEYKKQKKASKPSVAASAALHASLNGFGCASTLTDENLREVIILMKSGTPHEKIAATYDCSVSELKHIEKAFDRYRTEKDELKSGGESYTVSPEQSEFFLQLMANATPKSLGCGDCLLWNAASVAKLIRNATQIKPSRKSVATFLAEVGLIPREEDLTVTKTPEAAQWIDSEYRKIRMSALERDAVINWVFAPKPASTRKYLILCAVTADGSTSFGVYKGSGGFADFLNKLAQETHSHLYAVICTDYKHYKNLSSLSSDITLFPLGQTASIPDPA